MANIDVGNNIEKQLCNLFQENGYWVYRMPNGLTGQPCDIVALKNNKNWLIDSKHSKSDKFLLSRCEPNQRTTFEYATKYCGIKYCGFAIYFDKIKKFKWLSFKDIDFNMYRSVSYEEMEDLECLIKKI